MFVLTAGVLGSEFAIAKTLAAIGLGLFGGFVTLVLMRAGGLADPLREGVGNGGCGGAKVRAAKPVVWRFWQEDRSEEHTSELQSLMRISYAVFCLKKKNNINE